jgi:hypothetical protein
MPISPSYLHKRGQGITNLTGGLPWLPLGVGALRAPRDRSCARRKARGRMRLSRGARGALVIASKARCGPLPLRWAYLGAPRDRSYAR